MRYSTFYLLTIIVLLAGCGGGGGGGGSGGSKGHGTPSASTATVSIDSIIVSGATGENATVTVNGVADNDGIADTAFSVALTCNGGSSADSFPADPGIESGAVDGAATIVATNSSSNSTTVTVMVTFNP